MREVFGEILREKNLVVFFSYCTFYILDIAESISVRGLKLLSADRVQ